ncbi:hypothetical protein LCGC14_1433720 [marine sediment metagenome]|uniref:Uncharacterized protein n=1 Tax=marine sediment metagenome TaxID=412755 RepID=A0A0F9MPP5_9ZZZZ
MPGLVRRELVNQLDASRRIVNLTEATTLTAPLHAGRTILLSLLAGFTVTLPPATGNGDIYHFKVGIVRTSNSYIIAVASSSDTMAGPVSIVDTDTNDNMEGFAASGTSDTITMNATTTGGLTIGDWIELADVAANLWHVSGQLTGSGNLATPFSAAV